ncbi:recombinase family protein [Streptomyces sp. NPDC020379]|uniref:recombinase family protein n=1 Tax=Streptomyces sp. NPDC020379 TaxID=3365071 RepID=UPI0037988E2A
MIKIDSPAKVRAVVGARVSEMKGKGKVSHKVQWESGERHALEAGWEVVGEFQDLDVSATISPWDRPDLGPWLKERSHEWDAMIFAKVDRAFRSAKDCADVAHWAEQERKILVFTDDGITLDFQGDADSFATMMAKVFLMLASLFAEMELRRIKNRTSGAHRYLRTRDRWAGGQPPYGFQVVPHPEGGKKLAIDPVSSAVVRAMGKLLLDGKSLWEIADTLTKVWAPAPATHVYENQGPDSRSKRKTPPRNEWNQSSIGKIMRSEATQGFKLAGRSIKTRRVARGEDGKPIRIADPIFTPEEWTQIQVALDKRSRTKERSHNAAPLLGIVYCGGCQDRLYRVVNTSKGKEYEYYRCVRKTGKPACAGFTFKAAYVERVVYVTAIDYLGDVPVTTRKFIPGEDHSEELAVVVKGMTDVRAEKDQGYYDYPGGEDEYQQRIQALAAQRKILAALPQRAAEWVEEPTGEYYAEAYYRMDDQGRRALLMDAGVRVYMSPDGIIQHIPENLDVKVQAFGHKQAI